MRIVALEGPSFSGKTTTIGRLRPLLRPLRVVVFDCYVEQITEKGDIPAAQTKTTDEQMDAFERFMRIEADRVDNLAAMTKAGKQTDLVLLDRSVDTLLAHAHALDRIYNYGVFDKSRALLRRLPHLTPKRTFYLDAEPRTLRLRRQQLGGDFDDFLLDTDFLKHARDYFFSTVRTPITQQITVVSDGGTPYQTARTIAGMLR